MAEKNPLKKTLSFVEKHAINEKVKVSEAGVITIDGDIHETVVLSEAGISLDQYNKLIGAENSLKAAVTYVAGDLTVNAFKNDANLTETCFTYNQGSNVTVSGMFNRDSKDHVVVAVENKVRDSEFNRVAKHLNSLFDDINS